MWFMIGTLWFIGAAVLFSNHTAVKWTGNVRMNLKWPMSAKGDRELDAVAATYWKQCCGMIGGFCLTAVLAALPMSSLVRIGFVAAWVVLLLLADYFLYRRHIWIAYEMKRRRGWIGEKGRAILQVDTKVAAQKDSWGVSRALSLGALLAGVLLPLGLLLARQALPEPLSRGVLLAGNCWAALLLGIVNLAMYAVYVRGKSKVYSEDEERNEKCNRLEKTRWSWTVFSCGCLNLACFLGAVVCQSNETLAAGLLFGCALVLPATYLVTEMQVREQISALTAESEGTLYFDDDIYWYKGYYCNPQDPKLTVPKRTGYGTELNVGNRNAVFVLLLIVGLVSFVLLRSVYPMIKLEQTDFLVEISEDTVRLDGVTYEDSIARGDVLEVALLAERPQATLRVNGLGTSEYSIGSFTTKEYGTARFYLHADAEGAILIRTKETCYFINFEEQGKLTEIFAELKSWADGQ